MRICFGWSKIPLSLSSERRYYPEELQNMLACQHILWIHLDQRHIRLRGNEQVSLACELACVYHNGPDCRAPSEDGWDEETLASEEKAIEHMLAEASDEDFDTDAD